MSNATEMSTPLSRGELREELDLLRREFAAQFATVATKAELEKLALATKAELEKLATKAELEKLALATKAELEKLATKAELEKLATKKELDLWGGALREQMKEMEERLVVELARHTKASAEQMSRDISVIDQKYADLPGRVSMLEARVSARKRR
jgi:hypothetical protein